MDWEKIVRQIPSVIEKVRTDYVLNNMIIRDDIFGILEKYCNVIYYPMEGEKNCGFHTKRFVKDKLEDFVYINTAKPVADQVFTAAHELGHVWGVAAKVWRQAGEKGEPETTAEENIINRFAAELLMPTEEFRKTFQAHMREAACENDKLMVVELVHIMVQQMNDYMVPYESVRRRMIETNIISPKVGRILREREDLILRLVQAFSKDQNTMLDRVTAKKTIPGMRRLLEAAENSGELSVYTISRIKKDFDMEDISAADEIVEISLERNHDGED